MSTARARKHNADTAVGNGHRPAVGYRRLPAVQRDNAEREQADCAGRDDERDQEDLAHRIIAAPRVEITDMQDLLK